MKKVMIIWFTITVATAGLAEAQATRTWVSGVGDDANPCSRTAPCKTFAGAISKTAAGGTIDALDPGGYGAVTITKSITIDGGGSMAGILVSGTNGVVINAGSGYVILRNLTFEGLGTGLSGIDVVSAAQVHVEHCSIAYFTQNGIFTSSTGHLFVNDTTIKEVTNQGINVENGNAVIDHVSVNGNRIGVLAGLNSIVTVKNTVASGNFIGYGASGSVATQLNLEDSVTTGNTHGVVVESSAIARLTNMSVFNNTTDGLYNDGTGIFVSWGNNRFAGNATDGSFTAKTTLQ